MYDPEVPARDKTPTFGKFQLHRSHLVTNEEAKPVGATEAQRKAKRAAAKFVARTTKQAEAGRLKRLAEAQERWAAAGCKPLE